MAYKLISTVAILIVSLAVMAATFPATEAGRFLGVFIVWAIAYFATKSIWE